MRALAALLMAGSILCAVGTAWATSRTSTGDGPWCAAATWNPPGTPEAGRPGHDRGRSPRRARRLLRSGRGRHHDRGLGTSGGVRHAVDDRRADPDRRRPGRRLRHPQRRRDRILGRRPARHRLRRGRHHGLRSDQRGRWPVRRARHAGGSRRRLCGLGRELPGELRLPSRCAVPGHGLHGRIDRRRRPRRRGGRRPSLRRSLHPVRLAVGASRYLVQDRRRSRRRAA